MTEAKVSIRLNDIHPNDFPCKASWYRVTDRFPVADPGLLDLDSVTDKDGLPAVVITQGINIPDLTVGVFGSHFKPVAGLP